VVVAPKGVRPVEKEPRSVLPTAEGRSSFSRHTTRLWGRGAGLGAECRGLPGFCGEGPGLGSTTLLLVWTRRVLLSQYPHFLAPCSSCLKSPGFRATCSWLACGVSECVTAVWQPGVLRPHCVQACRVLSLTYNTFVTEYSVFNLYRIVRTFY